MSSAANAIDEEWVEKKLKSANSSQDSVQSLSLWALNHKTQHEKIVGIWFKVLKTAKLDLRLTLFYLCNEVVQTCKRKHAIVFKDAFKDVLKDAALLVRDNSIRPNIERIFKIWEERHVYNKEFVEELMAILNNTKVKSTLSTRLLTEFKPEELMRQMKQMAESEEEVEAKRLQLQPEQKWDAVDVESFKQQLKDRHECGQYVDQVNECRMQLESYVNDLQNETRDRSVLIQLLEQSELYYDAQNSEANIVATAYKNFGSRVSTLYKKLHESRKQSRSSPQIPTSSVFVSEKGKREEPKRGQDPGSTPTEDEFDFDDDSYDEPLINSTNQSYDLSNSSFEESSSTKQDSSGSRRNSSRVQRSPLLSSDSVIGDEPSGLGSVLANLLQSSSITASFLPSLTSHGLQPSEIPSGVHSFGLNSTSNSLAITGDEDEGGATPVQDEEPNEDMSLAPMEFLKQVILDSTKSSARRLSANSDCSHTYLGLGAELGTANLPPSSTAPWSSYDPAFSQPECQLGEPMVYEGFEDSYELIYPSEGGHQGATAGVYNPEAVQTYEVYASAYADPNDASQTYVLETGPVEGYPCAAEGYETVIEAYPSSDAEYHGAYQEQLISAVVDESYGDAGETYPVAPGDGYHSQTVSSSYYSVEHAPGAPPQPPVMYHAVQNYTQPPPTFTHPLPSLTPGPSFSHPPPAFTQPTALTFIHPPSFTTPPPLNQPPPPLFALPQNSTLPPAIPHAFIEPPPPSPYRLLSPASTKTGIGLPSPVLVPTPPSPVESAPSVRLLSPSYRQPPSRKSWIKAPYSQFKNDLGKGSAALRDSSRFENLSSSSDSYRMFRNQLRTRRTNLTYLTQGQMSDDRNGTTGLEDHSSFTTEAKARYPSSALRSMSLPCDSQSLKSFSAGQANGPQSASPTLADHCDIFPKRQNSESLLDVTPVRTDSEYDEKDSGDERDKDMLEIAGDGCDSSEQSINIKSGNLKSNTVNTSSLTRSATCNIPSLGTSRSPRTLMSRNLTPRFRINSPEMISVPPLSSFRFRAIGARRFPRKHFITHQMPFQRNFRGNY